MKHVFRTALCTALMTAAVCVPTFAVKADAPVPARQGDFYVLANCLLYTSPPGGRCRKAVFG